MSYLLLVDSILARVVLERSPGNDELTTGNDLEFIRALLQRCLIYNIRLEQKKTYQINNFTEMDFDAALLQVWILGRVVNELGQLRLAHLVGAETKDEEECINSIGLSGTVRPDDGRK